MGKYFGTKIPPRQLSSFNYLLLVFHSDSSISGRGFKANYFFVDIGKYITKSSGNNFSSILECLLLGCGGIYKKTGLNISPPMEGSTYKENTKCKWIIVAPQDHLVQLTFSQFQLEDAMSSDCDYDYVSIFNGYIDETSEANKTNLMGKFCGTNTPPTTTSYGNVLTIVFKTDDSTAAEGFMAVYSFVHSRNGKNKFIVILYLYHTIYRA